MNAAAKSKRRLILTQYLYERMPGAERVPYREDGEKLWGEVEHTEHFTFCEAIATLINDVDTRMHVEPD